MGRKPPIKPPRERSDLHLSLAPDEHKRICAFAGFLGCTVSQLVVRAVEAEARARRFVVYMGSEGGTTQTVTPPALPTAPERPQGDPRLGVVGKVG